MLFSLCSLLVLPHFWNSYPYSICNYIPEMMIVMMVARPSKLCLKEDINKSKKYRRMVE